MATTHGLIVLLIVGWCCYLCTTCIEASTKPVIGVVSSMAGGEDGIGSSLSTFYANFFGEGKHGNWGFFSGSHEGSISFNDGSTLNGLDFQAVNYMCGVRYNATDSPSKNIVAKYCLFSPLVINLNSVTANSLGAFATVSNYGRIFSNGQDIYSGEGTFVVHWKSNPEILESFMFVKHSKLRGISWDSIGLLDSSTFLVIGSGKCTQEQTPDKAIFSDNSEITFPTGCSIASFAALFNFNGTATLGKKQNLYKEGTGGLVVRKMSVASDKSFWICGNYVGLINFDGITQTNSPLVSAPFFGYYEIDNTKAEPFKFMHYTTITGFEDQQAEAVDMKIISGEIYVIGNFGFNKKSFLILYNKTEAGIVEEKNRLVVTGKVLFTGIDSNNDEGNQEIIITGYFENTIQIGSISLVSSGAEDIFVAAIKRTTLDVVWAIKEGGNGGDVSLGIKNNDNRFISIYGRIPSPSKFDGKDVPNLENYASNRFIAYLTKPNTCFGIVYDDDSVCSGHGACQNDGTCICSAGFGDQCEFPTCNGIHFNETNVCNGHGNCINYNNCTCNTGWSGQYCNTSFVCNSIASYNSSAVCSGNGECYANDKCRCNDEWIGTNCEMNTCFGISANSSTVCSKHGVCNLNHTCSCFVDWAGANCNISAPNCFGFSDNLSCSQHGSCISNNNCSCNQGWFGINCSVHSCNGTSAQDLQQVCNGGRGNCVATDVCNCNPDWSGPFCTIHNCFGTASNNASVCNSHGNCIDVNTCHCDTNWFGSNCSVHSCNGTSAQDLQNVCNGRGNCSQMDKCDCKPGWTGQTCEILLCFGLPSTDSKVCSGNGDCVSEENCSCNKGWFGSNCSIHSCNGTNSQDVENVCNGGKGQCIGMDLCLCNSTWSGQYCEIPKCFEKNANDSSVCSSNGQCIDVNTCHCSTNWFGSDCSIHSCNGTSAQDLQNVCNGGRGQCISVDNCSCNSNWAGQFCEIPKCFDLAASEANVCSGNGSCISPDVCTCNAKWFGAKCDSHSCFGIPFYNASLTCSSRGQCVAMDTCKCNNGFEGDTCSLHTCDGISSNDSRVCSNGQGQCTDANQCTCIQSETGKTEGPQCEMIYCNAGTANSWLPQNDPAVCSQHGKCQFNKTNVGCSCDEGFGGQICQYPICYGILANSKKVCNGSGLCSSPNNCSCFDNDVDGHFTGPSCEKCKIPYSGINCTTIEQCNATLKCNAHGTCDPYSVCTCYQDETNGYWCGSDCSSCSDDYYGEDCMTRISNLVFNNEGTGLIFKLYTPQYFTSLTVDCNKLLDSTAISLFGSSIVCRYSNKTSNDFIIEFGTDSTIQVNQEILMNRNVFNRNKLGNDYQSFKIGNALNPILPTISVSQKSTYSSCENILLDASASSSSDGKELSYKWEIVNSNILSLPTNNSSKLLIEYDNLNAGSHTFQLTVTSQVLKASLHKQVTFQKLNYATPVITIDGSDSISLSTSLLPLIVRKAITFPVCLPSNSEIIVKWEYLSGTGMDYEVDSYNNLKIVKFNDLTQFSHQFKVSSYLKGKEDQFSSANLNIQLSVSPLIVNLLKVESTIDQVTIEIEEIDSDLQSVPFERSWQTNNLNNNANLLQYLSTIKNNSLTITKASVNSVSQFDLSLTSSKVSRSTTSTLSIIFPESPAQIPPTVTLANSPSSKLNKGTLLSVQFIISSSSSNILREWTMDNKLIPSELTSNMRMTLSESTELILDTSSLTEGSTYQISFKVTNTDSSLSASSSHSFTINKSPKPCNCQVSPLSGIAMTTLFTFNCPNCQNDQNSNTFEYGFIDDFSGSSIPLSKTEELYQKLPIPNFGNKLDLYVKVVDTLTGASTTTTKQVTITLPVVQSLTEIKKLTASWNQIASLTPVGDYQRGVFNTATISRTMSLLIKSLSNGKRIICNGNGEMKDGKCVCKSGFTTSTCKWSIEDFEFIQSLISDLLNDFMSTNQIMTTSAEAKSRVYLTNLLFGLNSISQNVEYLSNQMVNSSIVLLRDALTTVQSSSSFSIQRGDLINLQNIINLQEELMSAVSNEKLMEIIDLLGQALLRNVLIGQTAIKFETDKYSTVVNKHFKNEMNRMKFESERVNITLPNDISILLKTNSIKSPISYRWNIQKNTDEIVTILNNKRAEELITINSVVNKLIIDPAPQTSSSKYLFEIEMKRYDSQANYICANIIGSTKFETDCIISIKNSQLATCECSTLGYNLAILEYKSLETPPSSPSTSTPNKSINSTTTKKPTSNSLMWLLMLLVLIPLTALFISVIIWFVLKKLNKKDTTELQENSSSMELKHV